jgi:hypothetical protein
MFLLFKLWIFNIDFNTIISFIIGILFGIIILCLIYAILVVASLGDKKYIIKTEDDSLSEKKVKELIMDAKKFYKDKKLRGKTGRVTHCYKIAKDLAYGIAASFYPNSKYPLLELTVDEVVALLGYIQTRVNELLDRRGLKILKRLKVSFITDLSQKTTTVINSKAFNVTKDVSKGFGIFKKVINVVNPVVWVRKAIIDNTMVIVLDQLCLVIITVVGEETYKIYSKKVLNKEVEIDSDVEELIDELKEEVAGEGNNEKEEELKLMNYHYSVKSSNKYESIYDSNQKMMVGGND